MGQITTTLNDVRCPVPDRDRLGCGAGTGRQVDQPPTGVIVPRTSDSVRGAPVALAWVAARLRYLGAVVRCVPPPPTECATAGADLWLPAEVGPTVSSVAASRRILSSRGAIRSARVLDQLARALCDALPSHHVHPYPGDGRVI
jgi:hypothetical protein